MLAEYRARNGKKMTYEAVNKDNIGKILFSGNVLCGVYGISEKAFKKLMKQEIIRMPCGVACTLSKDPFLSKYFK